MSDTTNQPSTGTEPPNTYKGEDDRTYVAGARYILPVDKREADRLQDQHKTFTDAFDDQVLIAPCDKKSSLFVLDSGTGTGIWLSDAAKQLPPSSILRGIDIEGGRFPPPGPERPRNMSFSVNSVSALPENWAGRFDLIHQRLLVCGLPKDDWPVVIAQMFRALRPGGWVQLGEFKAAWGATPCAVEMLRIEESLAEHEGLFLHVNEALPRMLSKAGFVDVRVDRRYFPIGKMAGEKGIRASAHIIGFFRALKGRVRAAGGLGLADPDAELERVINGLEKEFDETPGATIGFDYICGRKPDN